MATQPPDNHPQPDGLDVRIRTRAAYLGITISAVAERAGMHRQHLNTLARGYKGRKPSSPKQATKEKLAIALDVPLDYFDMRCCLFCGTDWRKIATMPAEEIMALREGLEEAA